MAGGLVGKGALTLTTYLDSMRRAYKGVLPLYPGQEATFSHSYETPLWIIAGPGSGKTHTLVWLVMKRILVDGVEPSRIVLTTFTRKAAAELQSRLIESRKLLIGAGVKEAEGIDISHIALGTLHALCSRILQDQRYEPTLRIRVLEDELVQQFFIRRSNIGLMKFDDEGFWGRFQIGASWKQGQPTRAERAAGLSKLFNRMTENSVDVKKLAASGDAYLAMLAQGYEEYCAALTERHRTDQAHLQKHFLNFLHSDAGYQWLGNGRMVVVDEYQDTNPIQEEIYFTLAHADGDLTVVGDDDQSLYRFRGATVESLIDFDKACIAFLGKNKKPSPVYLDENRRSHPAIVRWVNRFIAHHPSMKEKDPEIRVRAPGKPELKPASAIKADYPAVMAIVGRDNPKAGARMAATVKQLMEEKLLTDYSQVALLTFSTKESSRAIKAYADALRAEGIPYCNPRSASAQKDERFKAMIGGLSAIVDPDCFYAEADARVPKTVVKYVEEARAAFGVLLNDDAYAELLAYTEASAEAVRSAKLDSGKKVNFLERHGGRDVTISGLLYKLLSFEPFCTDLLDPEGGERLKALNLILVEYESLYNDGRLVMEQNKFGGTQVSRGSLYPFYGVFVEGIHDGLNDPEDDEVSVQPGVVNVMTIHQSKGLEFEAVFVLRPDKQPFLGDTHMLEDELDPFITRPTKPKRRAAQLRAEEDAVRLFYVAYSRAKRLLVLCGTGVEDWDLVLGQTAKGGKLNSEQLLPGGGVMVL